MANANARRSHEIEDAIRGNDLDAICGIVRLVRGMVLETCNSYACKGEGIHTRGSFEDDTTIETSHSLVGRTGKSEVSTSGLQDSSVEVLDD
jgi:hypothetical protein